MISKRMMRLLLGIFTAGALSIGIVACSGGGDDDDDDGSPTPTDDDDDDGTSEFTGCQVFWIKIDGNVRHVMLYLAAVEDWETGTHDDVNLQGPAAGFFYRINSANQEEDLVLASNGEYTTTLEGLDVGDDFEFTSIPTDLYEQASPTTLGAVIGSAGVGEFTGSVQDADSSSGLVAEDGTINVLYHGSSLSLGGADGAAFGCFNQDAGGDDDDDSFAKNSYADLARTLAKRLQLRLRQ